MQILYLRSVSVSAGTVLVAATVWGMKEVLAGVPRCPMFLLLPVFAAVYGVVFGVLSRRQ